MSQKFCTPPCLAGFSTKLRARLTGPNHKNVPTRHEHGHHLLAPHRGRGANPHHHKTILGLQNSLTFSNAQSKKNTCPPPHFDHVTCKNRPLESTCATSLRCAHRVPSDKPTSPKHLARSVTHRTPTHKQILQTPWHGHQKPTQIVRHTRH